MLAIPPVTIPVPEVLTKKHPHEFREGIQLSCWDFYVLAEMSERCRDAGNMEHNFREFVGVMNGCHCHRQCYRKMEVLATRLLYVLYALIGIDIEMKDGKGNHWFVKFSCEG